jgi:hypothetical protein
MLRGVGGALCEGRPYPDNKGLTGKNNDIVFIKFDDLIDEIKVLWEWQFSKRPRS